MIYAINKAYEDKKQALMNEYEKRYNEVSTAKEMLELNEWIEKEEKQATVDYISALKEIFDGRKQKAMSCM